MAESIRIVPLGGLGEIGMNCLAIESRGQLMLVDCGITFPEKKNGVDVIHPDFSYLLSEERTLQGVVITHGHEDHIGAVPYLLANHSAPLYAPAYAAALLERKLSEHELPHVPQLNQIRLHEPYPVGPFRVTHVRVTHSIADATALVIETPVGTLVHSGDFNIDPTPPDGEHFDAKRLEEVGNKGVRLLLSDSTNVDNPGESGSEATVIQSLKTQIDNAKARIVIVLFSSNIQRVKAVLEIAKGASRKVCLLGRSVQTHVNIAKELGVLESFADVLVEPKDIEEVPRGSALIVATGTQAEQGSTLRRLASHEHPYLRLAPGDTVVLSSRIIPGNERPVFGMLNELERRQINVITRYDDPTLHVSGHACQQEQRRMLELARPQTFIPVHGTYHHLRKHAELATEIGIKETLVIENGSIVEINESSCRVVGNTPTGRVHIQAKRALDAAVLADRDQLAKSGIAIVSFAIDPDGNLLGATEIFTRGILLEDGSQELLAQAKTTVTKALLGAMRSGDASDADALRNVARGALRRFFQQSLGQRPLTYAMIVGQ